MKRSIGVVASALVLASCATVNREQEEEIAQLRRQVEELKAELARSKEREKRAEGPAVMLYQQGLVLESEGRNSEAVKFYERAVRAGSGKAALRLGEIYERGIPGVSRDYAQSLKWYNAARVMGEEIPLAGREPLPTFEQAQALEREGRGADAVKAYVRIARAGNGRAAKRLGEIYETGIPGVERNFDESLRWYNAARALGEEVPVVKRFSM